MKMTKKLFVDAFEKTGMVLNFDRNYLMRKVRKYLEWLYYHCQKCVEMKNN